MQCVTTPLREDAIWELSVMGPEFRLSDISIRHCLNCRDSAVGHERTIAISDLLENNTFAPVGHDHGPYRLNIQLEEGMLAMQITDDAGEHITMHHLSLSQFGRLLRDYTRVCESYFEAIRFPGLQHLEELDWGRRHIHNKASELLREHLSVAVRVDHDTARRLFTLIYSLLPRRTTHLFPAN
ncbi:UPF0262 family protein [Sinorhizobium sp. CCBAU 05631]|uniref:UPF0262 family protein n=1 Tax=Sinorhizobium sp. CCBAU 05631 TaxID=794846 RepID=UPI000A30724F